MTPIERLGTGLAIIGIGIALFMGLPPPWWPDMPVSLVHAGVVVGVALIILGVGLVLNSTWSAARQGRRRMFPLFGMAVFGLGFLGCAAWYFWPAKEATAQAIARLAELGWTVKPGNDEILFEVNARPLPPMRESATYLSEIKRPFKLHFQQVPSLDGMHFIADLPECKNIEFNAGGFADLSELSGFAHLENLIISQVPFEKTQVIDPSPLASLVNLRSLSLNMSRIRSSDFLVSLKNLRTLNLGGTLISDLSPIAELKELQSLEIRDTRVADLRPLVGLSHLTDLTISGAQVPGLASLSDLPNLKRLVLIDQRPVDLSPVGNLKNLQNILIWGLPDFDVSPLHNLTKLQILQLSGIGFGQLSSIRNVESLENLTDLKQFTIGQIALASLDLVKNFPQLEELNLSQLPINSIAAVQGLLHLKKITMADIPVVDISSLLQVPNLAEVYLIRVPARADVLVQLQREGVKITQH
jgi:Leucine-rich repeat (LRR) protein